mmetsp:Transcript_15914/g.45590  ORF Transcript_15914/g.45590 Transcript_15914/m.45590 type:complete len:91 (-) Transcript_15914:554-826(-)
MSGQQATGTQIPDAEWYQTRKRSPLVLLGAGVTAAILGAGLFAYKSGNKNMSQTMMRARVVAQGVTVAIMMGTSGMVLAGGKDDSITEKN